MSVSWYIVADDRTVFHTKYLYWAWSANGAYERACYSFASKNEASRMLARLRKQIPGVKASVVDRASLFKALDRTDPQPDVLLHHDTERATPLELHRLAQAQSRLQFQRTCLRPPVGITPVVV